MAGNTLGIYLNERLIGELCNSSSIDCGWIAFQQLTIMAFADLLYQLDVNVKEGAFHDVM